ncbi:MAG: 30S ribosomal protein S20 [Alphaproteobacteria bacterium]
MANHKSAKKRIRQTEVKTVRNKAHMSALRTSVKKVEQAIASGNKEGAQAALNAAQPHLVKGAKRGLLHANAASRKISRLSTKIKSL